MLLWQQNRLPAQEGSRRPALFDISCADDCGRSPAFARRTDL